MTTTMRTVILITIVKGALHALPGLREQALHSAKGAAVETGCSDLYDVIHDFTI